MMLRLRLTWLLVVAGVVISTSLHFAQTVEQSTRSWPPDVTPYFRAAVREDYAPLEKRALPLDVFVADAVVSNTDPDLTNTDTFGDTEVGIAVNPENPDEIVMTAFSGGWGANAPIWRSTDGGNTWTKIFSVPVPPGVSGATGCPCDGEPGRLHVLELAGFRRRDAANQFHS